jgi:hypothetical protein
MRDRILMLLFLSFIPASVFSEPTPIRITVQDWQCYDPQANAFGGPYKTYCIENVTITADSDISKRDWNEGRWCLYGDQSFAAHGAAADATIEKNKVKIEFVDGKGNRHKVTFHVKSHFWERLVTFTPGRSWSDTRAPSIIVRAPTKVQK